MDTKILIIASKYKHGGPNRNVLPSEELVERRYNCENLQMAVSRMLHLQGEKDTRSYRVYAELGEWRRP